MPDASTQEQLKDKSEPHRFLHRYRKGACRVPSFRASGGIRMSCWRSSSQTLGNTELTRDPGDPLRGPLERRVGRALVLTRVQFKGTLSSFRSVTYAPPLNMCPPKIKGKPRCLNPSISPTLTSQLQHCLDRWTQLMKAERPGSCGGQVSESPDMALATSDHGPSRHKTTQLGVGEIAWR